VSSAGSCSARCVASADRSLGYHQSVCIQLDIISRASRTTHDEHHDVELLARPGRSRRWDGNGSGLRGELHCCVVRSPTITRCSPLQGTASLLTRVATEQAVPCIATYVGHWHYTTTVLGVARQAEEEGGQRGVQDRAGRGRGAEPGQGRA
jgi:hypothetical protein